MKTRNAEKQTKQDAYKARQKGKGLVRMPAMWVEPWKVEKVREYLLTLNQPPI